MCLHHKAAQDHIYFRYTRSSIINLNSIFLREGEGGRHIGVKTTFHDNESGKLAHIHPTLVSI